MKTDDLRELEKAWTKGQQELFNRAYSARPIANGLVAGCFLGIFIFTLGVILNLVSGRLLWALLSLFLAVLCYFGWRLGHGWVLSQTILYEFKEVESRAKRSDIPR